MERSAMRGTASVKSPGFRYAPSGLRLGRSITADTAVRLGRYFGNGAQFWLDLQSQYDIAVVERDHGSEINKRVRPADAA